MFITACNECGNSPQTVSRPTRHTFTHKKAPLPKITWTYRGGGRPLRLRPGSATAFSTIRVYGAIGVPIYYVGPEDKKNIQLNLETIQ